MIRLAKNRDIPIVFWLHNFAYGGPDAFRAADYVLVPSEFSREYHWNKLGLACQTMPAVIDPQAIQVESWQPRYVTFVNPQPNKGLYIFARIAEVLGRRRPDIPLLVVEGRSHTAWRTDTGIELGQLSNLTTIVSGPAQEFYAVTKLLLMPSLWNESFGLVAAEAMLIGIPVLASNRGALPETLGNAGFLFDIPDRYTPETRIVPTADEVKPWVETIIRLWDEAAFYEQASQAVRQEAQRWHPNQIAPIYREFFSNIFHQPGPPILPRLEATG
jgi:glycosyltransferase involved in cell wall biosynthesis